MRWRWMVVVVTGLAVSGLPLAGCAAGTASPGVPTLGAGHSATAVPPNQAALVHEVAVCIRQHGIPGYQEPVVLPGGGVYSDTRSIENASQAAEDAAQHACGALAAQADFNPTNEPPAPPALVEAGVRAATCERANGLPNVTDPTAQSPYTPGHGFGLNSREVPPGGKLSPGFQQAAQACRSLMDAEIQASTLSSLANTHG